MSEDSSQTIDEVGQAIVKHLNINLQKEGSNRVIYFRWDITYSPYLSNSHSCPSKGISNWDRDKTKPTSYKGWFGRVWVGYEKATESFGSDPFRGVQAFPGTGGYGLYKVEEIEWFQKLDLASYPCLYPLSWDFSIFEDDWPALLLHRKILQLGKLIKESKNTLPTPSCIFEYSDV